MAFLTDNQMDFDTDLKIKQMIFLKDSFLQKIVVMEIETTTIIKKYYGIQSIPLLFIN